jgi:hypothetical protein
MRASALININDGTAGTSPYHCLSIQGSFWGNSRSAYALSWWGCSVAFWFMAPERVLHHQRPKRRQPRWYVTAPPHLGGSPSLMNALDVTKL